MSFVLYKHNRTAYDAALSLMGKTGKAAIIHPTGTGKSFIGFQLSFDNSDKTICWLSPSEYIFNTQIENLKSAAGGYSPENIKFFTYAKLMNMSLSEIEQINPDFIIIDEFHRCGAELWGKGVDRLLKAFPKIPILGLSATNIRYLDNQRDMADELFDGNVASYMSIGEAIVRGILAPPKYVLSVYSYQKELKKYQAMVANAKSKIVRDTADEYLQALRKAIDKADGLDEIFRKHMDEPHGKYIVFCSNKSHMDEMIAEASNWFQKVDTNPHIYSVYSEDPTASKAFKAFKEDNDTNHLRLLYTINALNEGIHVSDISGVILLRPTVSPIIYKQQIGRALAVGKGKSTVIFDIVMNIEYLHSIGAIEDEMHQAMRYYTAEGQEGEIVNERFEIFDEVRNCLELFKKLNDVLGASWEYMFAEAKKYYEENGDLNVSKNYVTENGYTLGRWLLTQRQVYRDNRAGVLTDEQVKKLESIGICWETVNEQQWNRNFTAAKEYFERNGNLDVPARYVTDDGFKLGRWLNNTRNTKNTLSKDRVENLESIGMVWSPSEEQWREKYDYAKSYHEKNGHLKVPYDYVTEDGFRLGGWIHQLRSQRQRNIGVTEQRIQELDAIGMTWETKSVRQWEYGFSRLEQYIFEKGNTDVPSSYVTETGFKLGGWVDDQREKYRYGTLKKSRQERLEQVGFTLVKQDPWEIRYEIAKEFYTENHHLKVPAKYVSNGVWLNKWINEQKHIYLGNRKGKTLTPQQIEKLSAIGMEWPTANE